MTSMTCKTRVCPRCKRRKLLTKFNRNKNYKNGYSSWCRDCNKKACKLYYINNRERLLEKCREWNRKNKEKKHFQSIKRQYGVSMGRYKKIFNAQKGKCALCGKSQVACTRRLHIDHNHKTGEIRGLLCHGCNTGLGSFNDDISLLKKAISYLQRKDK